MKTTELFRDYNVPIAPPEHKHSRPGWVNTGCPFCTGNPGMHMGITLDGTVATCWRCGWHPVKKVVAKLLGMPEPQAAEIMREYGGTPTGIHAKETKRKIRIKAHKLPSDTKGLGKRHRRYLAGRNFDPGKLKKQWDLMGTGPISKLDDISYKHRILAPIIWNDQQVSFQTRDITGKHPAKYMACPEDRELIKHKHVLYGDQLYWKKTGICVEGITDVWRLGKIAFATFGIKYTAKQVREMANHFDRILILFDDDPQAQEQAKKLRADLLFRGVEAIKIDLQDDPASLTDREAKQLIKKIY